MYFQGHWAFIKNSCTWILVGRINQELCSLGINQVYTLHMERGRTLFIFNVIGQDHWAFINNFGTLSWWAAAG